MQKFLGQWIFLNQKKKPKHVWTKKVLVRWEKIKIVVWGPTLSFLKIWQGWRFLIKKGSKKPQKRVFAYWSVLVRFGKTPLILGEKFLNFKNPNFHTKNPRGKKKRVPKKPPKIFGHLEV